MQFIKVRGAVTAAAMMFVGLCGAAPSAAWAQNPVAAHVASAAAPAAAAVVATANPAAAVASTAMSGSAWIAQGTVLAQDSTRPAAPTGAIPMSMVPHAASLIELVGDMPPESDLTPDLKCLAQAVYFESRGEPIEGQLAVAEVVINRARSGQYPVNYCDVITQPAQFSFVHHGVIPTADETSAAWQKAKAIAEIAQQNLWQTKAADALYFHATYVNPAWAHQKARLAQIDTHIFYR
jgi:spore germination cell wall hydrolase CwlJ-like protein